MDGAQLAENIILGNTRNIKLEQLRTTNAARKVIMARYGIAEVTA